MQLAGESKKFWLPFGASLVVTVSAVLIFLAEASFRHSAAARTPASLLFLFPIPIIFAPTLGPIAGLLGLLQFPAYGVLLGNANQNHKFLIRSTQVLLVHGSLAALAVYVNAV